MTKTTIKTKIPVKYQKKITKMYENRVRKVPVQSIKPHTNFAEEIYQQQKTDKFFDRILIPIYIICAICAILLVIVNIK